MWMGISSQYLVRWSDYELNNDGRRINSFCHRIHKSYRRRQQPPVPLTQSSVDSMTSTTHHRHHDGDDVIRMKAFQGVVANPKWLLFHISSSSHHQKEALFSDVWYQLSLPLVDRLWSRRSVEVQQILIFSWAGED